MLFEKVEHIQIVGEAINGKEAVEIVQRLRPDVVLMDLEMPGMNGINATEAIVAARSPTRVIALSSHADKRYVGRMLEAGAHGYLLKDCTERDLVEAIYAVDCDLTILSESVRNVVIDELVEQDHATRVTSLSVLSAREQEILRMLADGEPTKSIAVQLSISRKTVDAHRQNIMKKLGTSSISQLIKLAVQEDLAGGA